MSYLGNGYIICKAQPAKNENEDSFLKMIKDDKGW